MIRPKRFHMAMLWRLASGNTGSISEEQQVNPIQKRWTMHLMSLLAGVVMMISGSTVGMAGWLDSPLDVMLTCSEESSKCWHLHGMNAENAAQVMDACWQEAKECPKKCNDTYFTLRGMGMEAIAADARVLRTNPPCSKAALEKWLDLAPVVIDANQGKIEIHNTGTAASGASRIAVDCSVSRSGKSTPCGERRSFDVPAMKPGGSYPVNLFGAGVIPRKRGSYTIKITVDPDKRFTEINKRNNVVSFVAEDAAEKVLTLKKMHAGCLKLSAWVDGHQKPDKYFSRYVSVSITSASTSRKANRLPGSEGSYLTVLASGTYDVVIHENAWGNPDRHLTVSIADGQTVEKTIKTSTPGELQLVTRWETSKLHDSACAVIKPVATTGYIALYAYLYTTGKSADLRKEKHKDAINCDPYINPVVVTFTRLGKHKKESEPMKESSRLFGSELRATVFGLLPGTYTVHVWPPGHKELQQTLENIRIEPGKGVLKDLLFDPPAEKK